MKRFKYILIGFLFGGILSWAGAATILLVSGGGTGNTSFPPNSILVSGTSTTNALQATSTITVNSINATSSQPSTFSSGGTTTVFLDTRSGAQGTCLKMKNATGTDYTYMWVGYGTSVFTTISCE